MAPAGSTGAHELRRPGRRLGDFLRLGAAAALLAVALATTPQTRAADGGEENPSCRTVRLSDVGWTDVTSTTATFSVLLRRLGYDPQTTVLSVPVTYASMKNKDIDVFLGDWMPTQEGDIH